MYTKRETNWSIRKGPSWDEDTSEDIQPQSQTAHKTFYAYLIPTYIQLFRLLPTKEIEPKHYTFILSPILTKLACHTSLNVIRQLT